VLISWLMPSREDSIALLSAGTPFSGVPVNFTDQLVPMVGPDSWDRRSVVSSQAPSSASAASSRKKRASFTRRSHPA
jgi:hypothetical protein